MTQIRPNGRNSHVHIVEKELSYGIIGCFYETYNELGGYGHSETTYANALAISLEEKGITFQREHVVDVYFRNRRVGHHRLDLLVEGRVVVEIKAADKLPEFAVRQVLVYLAATQLKLGLLLHFGRSAVYQRILSPALIRPNSLNSG